MDCITRSTSGTPKSWVENRTTISWSASTASAYDLSDSAFAASRFAFVVSRSAFAAARSAFDCRTAFAFTVCRIATAIITRKKSADSPTSAASAFLRFAHFALRSK